MDFTTQASQVQLAALVTTATRKKVFSSFYNNVKLAPRPRASVFTPGGLSVGTVIGVRGATSPPSVARVDDNGVKFDDRGAVIVVRPVSPAC